MTETENLECLDMSWNTTLVTWMLLSSGGRNLPGRKRCLLMDKREQFKMEIDAACDELKNAGMPHAIDLAKHICRMKRELMFYDKCIRRAGTNMGAIKRRFD